MGSLSPTAMRRVGRFGVPIVAALAAVLVSTQGASAATARPHPPVPPRCVQQPVPGMPGMPGLTVSQSGRPGRTAAHRPGKCVICIVHIKGGAGSVSSSAGDGQGTVIHGQPGPVTIGRGGGGVVSVGGPAPFCPPIKIGTSQR